MHEPATVITVGLPPNGEERRSGGFTSANGYLSDRDPSEQEPK